MDKDLHARIRDLASLVVGERVDRQLLLAVLVRNLTVEVSDFLKYHGDVSLAAATVRDHEILQARRTTKPSRARKIEKTQ